MDNKYIAPEMEITEFDENDIIVTSDHDNSSSSDTGEFHFPVTPIP